jgi:hypothetical protein
MKVLCAALVMAFPALAEAAVAGRVQFVAGDVRVVDAAGREQAMKKGQDINEGDTVLSAPSGSAQLRMIDGAIVALRPATQLKIVGYAFNGKEDGSERASFSLLKGGLRAITGLIGKTNKDHYRLDTPTATIGIRGTDHEPVVVLPPSAGETASAPAGTYDKVNVGATSLTTQAGTTVVAANQVGFAASPTQLPVILPKLPAFYRATATPQARQEKKHEQEQKQEQKQAQAASEQSGSADSAQGDAKTDTATATTTSTALTGTDANGNTLNLSSQTLTTSSGQQVSLTSGSLSTLTKSGQNDTVLFAAYPHVGGTLPQGGTFYYPAIYFFDGDGSGVTRDASGNVSAVSAGSLQFADYRASLTQSGSTLTDLGKDAATGLSWGRWQGGQVTQSVQYVSVDASGKFGLGAPDASGNFVIGATQTDTASLGNDSLHWITGSHGAPDYLPQVLTGTANYTMIGGTHPTDTQGNTGTLTGASLSANFTSQTVNANVNFAIGGNNWALQSKGMLLYDNAQFDSFAGCTPTDCISTVNVNKNGTALGTTPTPTGSFAFANMQGMLTGTGLNGAGLEYAVQETTPTTTTDSSGNVISTITQNLIQGVVAFSGPTQDVNTAFRAVGVNDVWSGTHLFSGDNLLSLASSGIYRGGVDGGITAVSAVIDSAAGLTQFTGSARGYTPVSGTADSSLYYRDTPAAIKIGSAVNRDVASTDVAGVTVSWGRWEGGSVDIYSRDGSAKLGTIDNSSRSIHWLTTSALNSQSFAPPLTGTATYAIVGSTSPTDLKGNVGKLTSATLNADFANAKVNAGVSVGFASPTNTSTWTMTANNIPLGGDGGFKSNTTMDGVNGITHTTTCSGNACGAQTVGQLDGHFVAGAQGAVIFYGIASGTTSTSSTGTTKSSLPDFTPVNMVSGLVVMKR